jgi:hypothetical protein
MKKFMFVFMIISVFHLLAGSCLALYTLTGTVYYAGTTTRVPNASVSLSSVSCTASTTADIYGGFTLQCSGDMSGSSITITASSPAGFWAGQKTWTVQPAGTTSQFRKIYIFPSIQSYPSLQLPSISTPLLGSPGALIGHTAPLNIQATGAPVAVQNVQVNILFDGPIVGAPVVTAPPSDVTITSTVPIPGGVAIGAEVVPPRTVPDFPAESFFDVFFEVEIPESGTQLVQMRVEDAIFNAGGPDQAEAISSVTDFLVGEYEYPSPYLLMDSQAEWQFKLDADWPDAYIRPLTLNEGQDYLVQLKDWLIEGEPYSPIEPDLPEFIPPELYVYEGDDDSGADEPDDAGLVMKWGDENTPDNEEKASAWALDYGDPDLSNCIIKVTASPPGPSGINRISLGMQDINGNIRSWWWNVPSVIPHTPANPPTTITIDTTQTGTGATNPPASGYANASGFDLTQVMHIIADENANWVAQQGAPAPGGQINAIWNYWHNLTVSPKTTAYKGNYVKFTQPPVVVEEDMIYGWDVKSVMPFNFDQGMVWTWAADDWVCEDERPVTDVHWWGSFIGWTQPHLPPQVPDHFLMAIWRDVPADAAASSHPKELLWLHECDNWVWNFAGYDLDPRAELNGDYNIPLFGPPEENEACFQFNQLLSEDDWLTPNIYWFSIAAVYNGVDDVSQIQYPWGWKSKPYDPNKAPDPAVVITDLDPGTPPWETVSGTTTPHITEVQTWFPIILPDPSVYPDGTWFDLAFELTTNEPKCPGLTADLNEDCIVSLPDFAIMAQEWLMTSP